MKNLINDEIYTAEAVDNNGEKIEFVEQGCCGGHNKDNESSCCAIPKRPEEKTCGCGHKHS